MLEQRLRDQSRLYKLRWDIICTLVSTVCTLEGGALRIRDIPCHSLKELTLFYESWAQNSLTPSQESILLEEKLRSDKAKQELEERLGEKERVLKDVQVSFDDSAISKLSPIQLQHLSQSFVSPFAVSLNTQVALLGGEILPPLDKVQGGVRATWFREEQCQQ